MGKNLEITKEMALLIQSAVGDPSIDVTRLTVFEASALSTRPLTKRGSLFDQGTVTRSTLSQMAEILSTSAVHLHTLHNAPLEIPVGRVFHGVVVDHSDGSAELRVLFYLPSEQADLINSIQTSSLDEVSVGVTFKSILCSECGFDFLGETSTFTNLFDHVCSEGHVLGTEGIHPILAGLDLFFEMSLVSKGASSKPKILSKDKSVFTPAQAQKLAAHGLPAEAAVLYANNKTSFSTNTHERDSAAMDKETLALLNANTEKLTRAEVKCETLEASNAALNTEVTALKTKVADLEASQTAEAKDLKTKHDEAVSNLAAAVEGLTKHYKAALTASGQVIPEAMPDVPAMLKVIEEVGAKLHQLIPAGGLSAAADTGKTSSETPEQKASRLSAFKIAR